MSAVACEKEVIVLRKVDYAKLQEQLILRTDFIMSKFSIREAYVDYVTQVQHDPDLDYINNRIFSKELEQFSITNEDVDNLTSQEQFEALCSMIPALNKF